MFGPVLLQEIECLRSDVALGVTPPDFVQDRALEQLKALRGHSSAASTMAAGFARKLSAAGLSQRYAASAATILRSEAHTSELQSLMRISSAVLCLKKKK